MESSFLSNRLLDRLPSAYRSKLLVRLEAIALPVGTILYRSGERPRHGHFMTSGATSIVTFMKDGSGVEVGLIGCEGLVEGLHLLGALPVLTSGFVQIAGTALRMGYVDLQEEFRGSEALRTVVLRSVQSQNLILSQIAACNRMHEMDQRMARWLLMVRDRIGLDTFELTQEYMAEMLGVQRTTVSAAARLLQRKGTLEYRRGRMHILDAGALEKEACECYPLVRSLMTTASSPG